MKTNDKEGFSLEYTKTGETCQNIKNKIEQNLKYDFSKRILVFFAESKLFFLLSSFQRTFSFELSIFHDYFSFFVCVFSRAVTS